MAPGGVDAMAPGAVAPMSDDIGTREIDLDTPPAEDTTPTATPPATAVDTPSSSIVSVRGAAIAMAVASAAAFL